MVLIFDWFVFRSRLSRVHFDRLDAKCFSCFGEQRAIARTEQTMIADLHKPIRQHVFKKAASQSLTSVSIWIHSVGVHRTPNTGVPGLA